MRRRRGSDSPTRTAAMVGKTISHYKILAKIGEGGMGVVYRAEDTKLKRTVALKFLRPEALESEEHKTRFLHEAQAAAALDHPSICTVHEIDEAEGQTFIAMAFVDGPSLKQKIEGRPLKLNEALNIALQIGEGLQAAHEKEIVHRDIKSANIMLTRRGQVKIMDFGLAHLAGRTRITKTGSTLGTPAYMSPEQVRGEDTDRRTDIWSLGVVLYEMVSGKLPFRGEVEQAVSYGILSEEPEPLTALRSGLPIELDRVVAKALAKSAEERYPHVDDMLVDLRALRKGLESTARVTPVSAGISAVTSALPTVQRRSHIRPTHVLVIAVAAMLAVTVAYWIGQSRVGREANIEPPRVVPLTTYPGEEYYPSFSPDANQATFSWNGQTEDNFDIYVKLTDSITPLRLTTDPAPDLSPVWSPDGRSIAFIRLFNMGEGSLVLIPAIGGPERILAESVAFRDAYSTATRYLAWFPDGKWLVAAFRNSAGQDDGLFLVSTETGETRRLTSVPKSRPDFAPAVSPDGRTLVFCRGDSYAANDLYLLSLAEDLTPEGEPRRRTFLERIIDGPTWTPDGRDIIFASGVVSERSLWRVRAFGTGEPQRLTFTGGDGRHPAVSLHGNKLAYAQAVSDTNIWRLRLPGPLNSPRVASASPARFISSTRTEYGAEYSPDGKQIAYESDVSGRSGIWVCEADGSNAVELFSHAEGHSGTPRWSPDGQHLAFDSNVEGQWDVYIIRTRGGKPTRFTTDPADDFIPSWSRDGRWIYFYSMRTGEGRIWKMPVEAARADSEAIQVTRKQSHAALPSRDGKFVYYTKDDVSSGTSLWRVPAGGGEEVEILSSVVPRLFSPVDEGIYFIAPPGSDGSCSLEFFRFADGSEKSLARLPGIPGIGLSVSPDGRSILYAQRDQSGSNLMLVENFR